MKTRYVATTLLTAMLVWQPASAQIYAADAAIDYVNSGMMTQSISSVTQQMALESSAKQGQPSPTPELRALRYARSDAVAAQVRADLVEQLAASDPAQKPALRTALSNDAIWQAFSDMLARKGCDSRNVADVTAAYYVSAWEIINDRQASATHLQAVRDQLTRVLVAQPRLSGYSDQDKQQAAEAMGLRIALAGAADRQLARRGDRQARQELQKMLYASVLDEGVDLKAVRLSSDGFSRDD